VIVVFGSINADLSFAMHELPAPGQTFLTREMRLEFSGESLRKCKASGTAEA
jgi:hypothetical protein